MPGSRLDPHYLQSIENSLTEIVRGAGQVALRHFHRPLQVEFKGQNLSDPVTQADREVEEFLLTTIAREYPDHGILGEEGTQVEIESRDYLWVLDPVDGTTNFLNGLPLFGCSAGLLYRGQPVAGAIFLPVAPRPAGRCAPCGDENTDSAPLQLRGAVLHARLGGGTHLDGEKVETSPVAMPGPSNLAGLPGHHSHQFQREERMRQSPGELRCLGSVTYETAMVACGIFGYSIFRGPRLWDMAAGTLLVREAGGEALVWKGGWEPLHRFEPMPSRKNPRDLSLRHWRATVLVGGGRMAWFVADRVRPGTGLLGRLTGRVNSALARLPRR